MNFKCKICLKSFLYKKHKNTKEVCSSCLANSRRFDIKIKAVTYKGGSCSACGYDKCVEALAFHHLDPTQKDFSISGAHCRSWEKIKNELNKCILVCHNCHTEIHSSERDKDLIQRKINYCLNKKKIKKRKKNFCLDCNKEIKYSSIRCINCSNKNKKRNTKINWPPKEELERLLWEMPTTHLAKKLGISDKAITKKAKKLKISKPPRGYWSKKRSNESAILL